MFDIVWIEKYNTLVSSLSNKLSSPEIGNLSLSSPKPKMSFEDPCCLNYWSVNVMQTCVNVYIVCKDDV